MLGGKLPAGLCAIHPFKCLLCPKQMIAGTVARISAPTQPGSETLKIGGEPGSLIAAMYLRKQFLKHGALRIR
ncbi:hypothetical protein PTKU64_83580 [Paraburkholderia terrae]|uniref:Uncharacterized protein n=1 Tax=Paraburkholderia terrae TaxID=311230 RepID=A0ABM7U0J1_9BURK|nr:hypothetical protein PTKU64_83580 [Paraburkholderia terrae]